MNKNDQKFLREIGFRIREKRLALDLTQEELAQRCDLHRTYIGSVERGERNISILNLRQIAKILKTTLSHLLADIP